MKFDNGIKLGLVAIILWSTAASAFKIALISLSVNQILFISVLVSIIVFAIISLISSLNQNNNENKLKKSKLFNFSIFSSLSKSNSTISNITKSNLTPIKILKSLLNPFLYYLLLFAAYDALPAQIALSINYLWPIILVLILIFNKKIPFSSIGLISLMIAFLGFYIIISKGEVKFILSIFSNEYLNMDYLANQYDSRKFVNGIIFALMSSLVWALSWILNTYDKQYVYKKNSKNENNDAKLLLQNFTISFVALLFFLLIFQINEINQLYKLFISFDNSNRNSILASVYIGLFEMGFTFLIWSRALKETSNKMLLSNLVFLSPFLSMFWINYFTKEIIHNSTIFGLLLIVISIILSNKSKS